MEKKKRTRVVPIIFSMSECTLFSTEDQDHIKNYGVLSSLQIHLISSGHTEEINSLCHYRKTLINSYLIPMTPALKSHLVQ